MARIITPALTVPRAPTWKTSGEEVVTIALDKNEVVAIVTACLKFHKAVENDSNISSTCLNAAGARVYEQLLALKRENDWH